MNKYWIVVFTAAFGFLVQLGFASPLVTETPIRETGTGTTVTVSSTVWTKVPAVSSLSGRTDVIVSFETTGSTRPVAGNFGACSGFTEATTIRPLHFPHGSFTVLPFSDTVCLYLLSTEADATQSVHVKEGKR